MQQGKPNLYAWFVFLLAAGFLFYKYLAFIAPAVIAPWLIERYSLSATALGFGVSVYFYSYLLMQIPAGVLIDRYGTRTWTSLAILSCALGMLLMGTASSWAIVCLGRFLIGFGAAFAITAYMKLISTWFPTDYFPFMATFFGVACMAGAGTAETPLAWITLKLNPSQMLIICASIGLTLSVFTWFGVKSKPQEKRVQEPTTDHSFSWHKAGAILKSPANLALICYTGLAFTPLTVFAGLWGIPFVMEAYHLDTLAAASIVSFSFFGFIVGGLMGDPLAKKIKSPRVLLLAGTALTFIALALIIFIHFSEWLLTSLLFLFGIFSSTYLLNYGFAKHFNSLENMSTTLGMMNMAGPLGSLIAEPLVGKIIDLHWPHAYQWSLSLLLLNLGLAFASCLFIRKN